MRYELWRGDSSVRLVQPDGKAVVIRDERIGRFSTLDGVGALSGPQRRG
jgi:hypothetical protein